jgi:serine protease Do
VWYAKDQDFNDYDLAILIAKNVWECIKAIELTNPYVLDDVLTMGYPPIPGLNPILISETSAVASYVQGRQKSSVGQIVAEVGSYMSELDFFVITARVKGGNSGCPVINNEGYVVGTVFQIPFDSYGGSDGGRYDIMGYGVCLPSKYVIDMITNPDIHQLVLRDVYYIEE